jgi:hypothetical protein
MRNSYASPKVPDGEKLVVVGLGLPGCSFASQGPTNTLSTLAGRVAPLGIRRFVGHLDFTQDTLDFNRDEVASTMELGLCVSPLVHPLCDVSLLRSEPCVLTSLTKACRMRSDLAIDL